ncbi:MAG: hypothetical protein QM831_23520 [Kofleriaceae bacterium]
MRFAIALLLAACDAYSGSKPQPQPQATPVELGRRDVRDTSTLKLDDLQIHHVPRHGIIHAMFGMGGYRLVEVIDLDIERLTVMEQASDPEHDDPFHEATLELSHAQAVMLHDRGESAWREQQQGPNAGLMDVAEALFVIDGDHAFEANTTLFQKERPRARELIDAIYAIDDATRDRWQRR